MVVLRWSLGNAECSPSLRWLLNRYRSTLPEITTYAKAAKLVAERRAQPVVAVAATERALASTPALAALTAAALLLPGIACTQTTLPLSVKAHRFEEGKRQTAVDTGLTPLQAYTLDLRGALALNDKLSLNLTAVQDTWSGATPVASSPLAFGANRPRRLTAGGTTVISGASPLLNGSLLLDNNLAPIQRAGTELVMSSASPELRQEVGVGLQYALGSQKLALNAGYSDEGDFRSRHVGARGEMNFNENHTTVSLAGGYTDSTISADIAGTWLPYVTTTAWQAQLRRQNGGVFLEGNSHESTLEAGFTQVLNAGALFELGFKLQESGGMLENPYRAVTTLFVDPLAPATGATVITADVRALLEQRPDNRRMQALSARYVQHIAAFNAALHVNYDYSKDDWEVHSQAIELAWLQPLGDFLLAPRLRWYSQNSAWFHTPYLISKQRYRGFARDDQGREIWLAANDGNRRYVRTSDGRYLDEAGRERDAALLDLQPVFSNFSPALLPTQYSSDPRLGGFGVLSTGFSLQRHFDNGLTLDIGIDHYRRASSLQFNGNGDTPYADFNYTSASVAFSLDWQMLARRQRQQPTHATHEHAWAAPAGLMLNHEAGAAGSMSTGYRMQQQEAMTMHMLDFAWHPRAEWTLMVMPQFMTMHNAAHGHSLAGNSNDTSHFGDTLIAALWHRQRGNGEWQITSGFGVPATGTGTADLLPAVQYRHLHNNWQVGVRVEGSFHLATQHVADLDSAHSRTSTLWLGRTISPRLSTTVRIQHVTNEFPASGKISSSQVGAGFAFIAGGSTFALEWLTPIHTDNSALQMQRGHLIGHTTDETVVARWHLSL